MSKVWWLVMAASSANTYRLPFQGTCSGDLSQGTDWNHRTASWQWFPIFVIQGSFQFLFVTPCNVLFPKQPWNRYWRGKHRFHPIPKSELILRGFRWASLSPDGLVGLSPTLSRNVAEVASDHYGCAVLEKGLSHGEERQVCYGSEHVGMHGVAQTYLPLNWMNLWRFCCSRCYLFLEPWPCVRVKMIGTWN